MIALSCSNISKSYGIDLILENISFTLNENEKIGLIGQNGAGKTTLFKILTGQLKADSGELYYQKEVSIGYLKQAVTLDIDTSLYDYCMEIFENVMAVEKKMRLLEVALANPDTPDYDKILQQYASCQEKFEDLNGYSIDSRVKGVLNGLGFSPEEHHRPINQLSGGQKSRVSIAKLLLDSPDILLLDEPTNHLDIESTMWLESFLKEYHGTVIIISHDRYFLDQIITKTVEIENHHAKMYHGNYSYYAKKKKEDYINHLKSYEKNQKELKKQEELIRKFKERGTEKLAKRARSREKRLDHFEVIDKPELFNYHFNLKLETAVKSGNDVLFVDNLAMAYGEKNIFNNVNFEVYRGDKIGLIGPNGVGKTTLFKILLKQLEAIAGDFEFGTNVLLDYYDQEMKNLNEENNLIEEISDLKPQLSTTEIRNLLGAFLFRGDEVDKAIHHLSGGEKGRISLLKIMLSKSNLLLLDEPTNHLDIASKEVFEEAIKNYNGTVISISHDRYYLNNVCDKILYLSKEGTITYLGNYDYYLEKIKEKEGLMYEDPIQSKTKTQLKAEKKKEKEALKKEKSLRKEIENIEKSIHENEENLTSLQEALCDETVYTDSEKVIALQKQISDIEITLEMLYSKWEEHLNR